MDAKCCDVNVVEIDNGYRIEITGDEVKGKCKDVVESICAAAEGLPESCKPKKCC